MLLYVYIAVGLVPISLPMDLTVALSYSVVLDVSRS